MTSVQALITRANKLNQREQHRDAIPLYDEAIRRDPRRFDAWCNKGIAYGSLWQLKRAEECFRKAIEISPKDVDSRGNLGNLYCVAMQLDLAEQIYREGLKFDPANVNINTNLGRVLLGQDRWQEGFPHYAFRFEDKSKPQPHERKTYPQWNGEVANICLYAEQGYGDEIMCLRFVPYLRGLGLRVRLHSREPMRRLVPELLAENPDKAEFACSLMDVPAVLGISAETMPCRDGYLKVPDIPPPLLPSREGPRIGLCWYSGYRPQHPETIGDFRVKSIPLHLLKPLIDCRSDVTWISLQKDYTEPLMRDFNLHYVPLGDFADTAAAIGECDLVISTDTSVAHLAAALGRPIWNFVRFSGFWPWRWETRETCWYSSMRIYRQPALHDWATPILRAAQDLSALRF